MLMSSMRAVFLQRLGRKGYASLSKRCSTRKDETLVKYLDVEGVAPSSSWKPSSAQIKKAQRWLHFTIEKPPEKLQISF